MTKEEKKMIKKQESHARGQRMHPNAGDIS